MSSDRSRPPALPSVSTDREIVRTLRQNWILDPVQDGLFIIAAPVIVLVLALLSFRVFTPGASLSWISVIYLVATVAHHMPTFLRIYGDVDLFRRFKWSFILGPLIPFAFAVGVLVYLNIHNYPVENFFYLLIILTIWDPWHFLMQHYGFMRIYDRPNAAPKRLAARMDLALCATWFTFIMLASGDWLAGLLLDLYAKVHLPIILSVPVSMLRAPGHIALWIALGTTVAYGGYLVWCWRKDYFISAAKIALML